jgi:hypothetical protein
MRADRGHVTWQQHHGEGKACEAARSKASASGGHRQGRRASDDCRSGTGKGRSTPTLQWSGALGHMPVSHESSRAFWRCRWGGALPALARI